MRAAEDIAIAATETVSMDLCAKRTLHKDGVGVPTLNWSQRNSSISRRCHNLTGEE